MSRATNSPSPAVSTCDPDDDLNRVLLTGTLAEAAELRELEGGFAVCFLRLQCPCDQAPQILADDGRHDVNVLLSGEKARKMAPYLYAGRRVVVDGSLASTEWEAMGVEECESVCVVGQRVEFIGGRPARRTGHEGDAMSTSTPMVGFSEDVWF